MKATKPELAARATGPRRLTDKARRREAELCDVAAEIFQEKGYAATTLRDIADALGMLKGSLYYYIDSKEDLLYRIISSIHADGRDNLEQARSVEGAPVEKLRALLEGQVLRYGKRLSWVRVFYSEYRSLSGPRQDEINLQRREYRQYVEHLVALGQADGSFCPELDLRVATNSALSVVNMVYQWYRPSRNLSLETVARIQSNFVIRGLRCASDHRHLPPGRSSAGR